MNSRSCILTVVKNEQLYLDEWITYHTNLGIDRFFIIEDIDSDSHKDITDKYDNVTLINIESFYKKDVYKHIINVKRNINKNISKDVLLPITLDIIKRDYSDELDWCFVLDDDEFLTLENDSKSLSEVLSLFDNFDAFVLQWDCYGANGHVFRPDYTDKGVVGTYTEKAVGRVPDAQMALLKTCFNLKTYKTKYYNNYHYPHLCRYVNTDFNRNILKPSFKNIYIRHYITRSLEEYVWKNDVRGYFHRKPKYNTFFKINPDMADKQEEYIQAVKNKLSEIYPDKFNTEEN